MLVEVDIIQKRRYTFAVEVDDDDYDFTKAKDIAYEIYEKADDEGTLDEYFNDCDIEIEV